jgi:hypothetical protein
MAQRIVYLSWPAAEITGGIKLAFRHVEILREAGIEAVIATEDAKPPGWFQTDAPLIEISQVLPGEDILVFPENNHRLLNCFASWSNLKVVFCQNQFMAYRGLGGQPCYATFGVSGILCECWAVADFCRLRFPTLPIHIVPVCIDQSLFQFQPQKKLQIAFAPRKRPAETQFIFDLCRHSHPEFGSVPWIEISGLPEEQVAAVLKESAIYLSPCRFDAYSISILEAFACGCIAAGFTGGGSRVYTNTRNGLWAEEDDCMGCAEQLWKAAQVVLELGPRYYDMIDAARCVADQHSPDMLARRLVPFWQAFLRNRCFPNGL